MFLLTYHSTLLSREIEYRFPSLFVLPKKVYFLRYYIRMKFALQFKYRLTENLIFVFGFLTRKKIGNGKVRQITRDNCICIFVMIFLF
jgi:hypothetical protein